MQKTLFLKLLLIGILMAIIAVPLMMIESTIYERSRYRDEAVASVTQDSVGAQTLSGPLIVIPYTETWEEEVVIEEKPRKTEMKKVQAERRKYVFAETLDILSEISTQQRHRGIYDVLVYGGMQTMSGSFTLPPLDKLPRYQTNSSISLGQPFVALGISDTRGVHNFPKIKLDGQSYEFKQESRLRSFPRGLHAPLELAALESGKSLKFDLQLELDGVEHLSFIPLAKDNHVQMAANWPHPQFSGRFLPSTNKRVINDKGFNVHWNVSSLASNAQQQLLEIETGGKEDPAAAAARVDQFSVAFIEPVNIYTQAGRAAKYGLLFIALTFASFFLFEILKQLPVHPVQYALVGLALVLFFLLLLSLSEHLSFLYAYLIASTASILLLGFYLSHVLRDVKRGIGFATALTVLYGVLYGLLQSESNALLMGSILLFAALSVIMIVTRKVDWYQLGQSKQVQ